MSEYQERDTVALGEHYVRHVHAMTHERLYAKSDIAAELAHRDSVIAGLLESLDGFISHGTCFDDEDMARAVAARAKATGQEGGAA